MPHLSGTERVPTPSFPNHPTGADVSDDHTSRTDHQLDRGATAVEYAIIAALIAAIIVGVVTNVGQDALTNFTQAQF